MEFRRQGVRRQGAGIVGIAALVVTLVAGVLVTLVAEVQPASADSHPGQSVNVVIIDSTSVISGGTFPTTTSGPTGAFTDFTFFFLAPASVSAAALAPGGACGAPGCDTVLLNVASRGMSCDTGNLSAAAKADLVSFVGSGKKMVIYDSECPPQDYSWLPFAFTTSNPGALGAFGTLTITEDNTLSSANAADSHFIDAPLTGSSTDAVGDMNVMTTFDPNWCLDMSGTNALPVTGPVHTYARFGSPGSVGLFIYNGLDMDRLSSVTPPDAATGPGNLAKIWLQELQQPTNPDGLPCAVTVVGITLNPPSAQNPVGASHTVTAHVTDLLGAPVVGTVVTFAVTSGPNVGVTGTGTTNASGDATFSYTSSATGTDTIQASFVSPAGPTVTSTTVTKTWTGAPNIVLNPASATNPTGANHVLTATATDGAPAVGVTVTFNVVSGPNVGVTGTGTTNASGDATFSYTSSVTGTDTIQASFVSQAGPTITSNAVTKTWTGGPPASGIAKVTGGGRLDVDGGRINLGTVAIADEQGQQGNLQVRDHRTGDRFHGFDVDSLSVVDSTATWHGSGRWNGEDGYTFEITVVDNRNGNSNKKGDPDTVEITIRDSGGTVVWSTGGPVVLTRGNLTVH